MKNKQTLFTLMAALILTAGTASAAPVFSSEDPEVQSVWSFFLPFLTTQSESEKANIKNQLLDIINEQATAYFDEDDMDEDWEGDFEDYDFSTEKPEIIAELTEELAEIDDANLKSELTSELESIKSIQDEDAFWEAVDAVYEKVDAHFGYPEYEDDMDFVEMDFSKEKPLILRDLKEEMTEIQDAQLKSDLSAAIKNLEAIGDEEKFFNALEEVYEKIDNHFGYDDEDYEITECDFGHGEDDEDDWDDRFFDFDDEDDFDDRD